MVDVAREVGADAVAHGCTGKGNDQVLFGSFNIPHLILFTNIFLLLNLLFLLLLLLIIVIAIFLGAV